MNSKAIKVIDLILLTLLLPFKCFASELEITKFEVPLMAEVGRSYQLICAHNLNIQTLYSLQWLRNETEFFRFEPKGPKVVQVFPIPGINLNMRKSLNGTRLVLDDVDENTSGKYKCDVTKDGTFFTVSKEQMMTVTNASSSLAYSNSSQRGHVIFELTNQILTINIILMIINQTFR